MRTASRLALSASLCLYKSSLASYSNVSTSTLTENPQIYSHQLGPLAYKFSLLPDPKYIGLGTSVKRCIDDPEAFVPNKDYVELLHKTIAERIHNDFTFIVEAGMNASTHMPIYDLREVPNYARIPDIENIFGYIQVDDKGKMIPGSYQSNNMYRLYTGLNGLSSLSDYLLEEMRKECSKLSE